MRRLIPIVLMAVILLVVFTVQARADGLELRLDMGGDSLGETGFLPEFARLYTEPQQIDPAVAGFWLAATAGCVHFDQAFYDSIHNGLVTPEVERFSATVTKLGEGLASLIVTGLVWLDDGEAGRRCLEAILFAGINVQALKMLLGMARPYLGRGPVFTGPTLDDDYMAMPSGHTANAFALATVLAATYPRYRVIFYCLAGIVGLSRVILEEHWFSNVFAGGLLGIYAGQRVLGREFTVFKWEF